MSGAVRPVSDSAAGVATRVLLICKAYLVDFYTSCGFDNLGPSDVVHGQDPWLLMGVTVGGGDAGGIPGGLGQDRTT